MMARPDKPATTAAPAEQPAPAYYIADEPLFIGIARAHNPGDLVPADHVERYGWRDKVHPPESPTTEPVTASGQAPTEGEGDA
jgi:hypothetical protein